MPPSAGRTRLRVNLEHLIEMRDVCVKAKNKKTTLVGHAAVCAHPAAVAKRTCMIHAYTHVFEREGRGAIPTTYLFADDPVQKWQGKAAPRAWLSRSPSNTPSATTSNVQASSGMCVSPCSCHTCSRRTSSLRAIVAWLELYSRAQDWCVVVLLQAFLLDTAISLEVAVRDSDRHQAS